MKGLMILEEATTVIQQNLGVPIYHACSESIENSVVCLISPEIYKQIEKSRNIVGTELTAASTIPSFFTQSQNVNASADGIPIVIRIVDKSQPERERKQFFIHHFTYPESQDNASIIEFWRELENYVNNKVLLVEGFLSEKDKLVPRSHVEIYQLLKDRCLCVVKNIIVNSLSSQPIHTECRQRSMIWIPGNRSSQLEHKEKNQKKSTKLFLQNNHQIDKNNTFLEQKYNYKNSNYSIIHHPSISKLMKVIKTEKRDFLIFEYQPFTLDGLLKFSSGLFNETKKLFVFYQLIRIIYFCHNQGLIHGNLKVDNVLMTDKLWVILSSFKLPREICYLSSEDAKNLHLDGKQGTIFSLWYHRKISNFDYLMALNRLAKRREGFYFFNFLFIFPLKKNIFPNFNNT